MSKWVFNFGNGAAEGTTDMRDLLGGKGANLAEMANLGLPVPPGFTITTEVCTWFFEHGKSYPPELEGQVDAGLAAMGKIVGHAFGDPDDPLLVSVRSGARASMPGMMDTVLNLGLADDTVEALARRSGNARFAYDTYRRFIQMYSNVVLGVDHHEFEDILENFKDRKGFTLDTQLAADDWQQMIKAYKAKVAEATGKPFPQDPREQLWGGDRRGVQLLDEPAGRDLPALAEHPAELGHGRQHPIDGLREYGRDLGDRCRFHAQSLDR